MSNTNGIHTISILVANKPGVLVRCAQIFARRAFNIDALVVSPAVNPKYSRMTITLQGDIGTFDQIIKQTNKLVDVIHCSEHTGLDAVTKEYALLKLKCPTEAVKTAIKKAIKSKAHIVDQSVKGVLIIGQSGSTEEFDDLEKVLKKFKIIEMVRSGKLAMAKGLEAT